LGTSPNENAVTVTDGAVTGPDGSTLDGTTVVGSAGDWYVNLNTGTLPAGTYTYSIDMQSNNGATQSVRIGNNGSMTTVSVTTAWTTFDSTFTLGAPSDVLRSLSAVTALARLATSISATRGLSLDPRAGPQMSLSGHMRLGSS
jgi:hypothetical protein